MSILQPDFTGKEAGPDTTGVHPVRPLIFRRPLPAADSGLHAAVAQSSGGSFTRWAAAAVRCALRAVLFMSMVVQALRLLLQRRSIEASRQSSQDTTTCWSSRTWDEYPVDEIMRRRVDEERQGRCEILLARIDMSGRAYCPYGAVPFLPLVQAEQFMMRDRYEIDIVLYDGNVLLRKDYRGRRVACFTEWVNLESMRGKAHVPVIRNVNLRKAVLHMDYIFGRSMLEILRDHGALMRDSDVENDPAFIGMDPQTRQRTLDQRAAHLVTQCFSEEFFQQLEDLLDDIHRCCITDLDIRFANVIVDDSGRPWMIDFHEARYVPRSLDWIFRLKRKQDHDHYDSIFSRHTKLQRHQKE